MKVGIPEQPRVTVDGPEPPNAAFVHNEQG